MYRPGLACLLYLVLLAAGLALANDAKAILDAKEASGAYVPPDFGMCAYDTEGRKEVLVLHDVLQPECPFVAYARDAPQKLYVSFLTGETDTSCVSG